MANHPNRNWRARMRASADQWSASQEGLLLADTMVSRMAIVERLRLAYLAGLRDGEKRDIDLFELAQ